MLYQPTLSLQNARIIQEEKLIRPAKDFVIFSIQTPDEQTYAQLEIRDLSGRLIYTQGEIVGSTFMKWKTGNTPTGIYFYRLRSDRGAVQSGKVILNK